MLLPNLFLVNSLFFLLGILIASLNLIFFILPFIFLIFGLAYFKFKLTFEYILIFIFAFLIGFLYFHFRIFLEDKNINIIYNKEIEFIGKISSDVLFFENYKKFTINLQKPFNGKVDILTSKYNNYQYGDILKFNGIIEKRLNINQNPISFYPEIIYLENIPDFKLLVYLYKIKNYFLEQFRKYFVFDEQALLSGIILGQTSEFSKDFKDKMNNSGTTHIVALSGYNVGILILIVNSIFIYIFGRKNIFIISLFIIFCFVIMTGGQSSVLRATIMASFLLLAQYIGRIYSFWHSLIFTSLIMNLINPKILVYDLGFQLSFLSILGIVYFKPYFDNIFKLENNRGFLNWKENLNITLSSQLAVWPLIFLNFGRVSFLTFLTNILILMFIPLTMFFGFLVVLFSFIKPLSFVFGLITSFILRYEIFIINFFGSLSNPFLNFISMITIFIFYLWFIYYIFKFKYNKLKNE